MEALTFFVRKQYRETTQADLIGLSSETVEEATYELEFLGIELGRAGLILLEKVPA